MSTVDTLQFLKDLLEDNWNSNNTNGETPVVRKMTELTRADYQNKDLIIVYTKTSTTEFNGMGATSRDYRITATWDIGTDRSYNHMTKMVQEAERIANNNVKDPDTDHDILDYNEITELSDKTKQIFRQVIELEIKRFAINVP